MLVIGPVRFAFVTTLSAVPLRDPANVVAVTVVSPEKAVAVPPKLNGVEPIVTELYDNLLLAILPANILFVTVPVSDV